MSVTVRAQCQVWADSTQPRDAMSINPCFQFTGALFDGDGFCLALANSLKSWIGATPARQIQVKTYDVEGTRPVYPNGQAIISVGAAPVSTVPRELAICLSFYAGQNRPSTRGRLYIPLQWITTKTTDVRPSQAQRDLVGTLVSLLAGAGGADVDWGVWSGRNEEFHKATNWWVDDEWDIIRSRGLRGTARSTGTTSG